MAAAARYAQPDRLRDLGGLLRNLRTAGLPIYPLDIVRLQQACRSGVSTRRKEFLVLLKCTLAKNGREAEILEEQFDLWWSAGSQWIEQLERPEEKDADHLRPDSDVPSTDEEKTGGAVRTGAPLDTSAQKPASRRWREQRSWKQRLRASWRQGWDKTRHSLRAHRALATLASIALIGAVLVFWAYSPAPQQDVRPIVEQAIADTPPPAADARFQPVDRYYSWIPRVKVMGQDYTLPLLASLLLACLPLGALIWRRYKHSSSPPPPAREKWQGPAWRPLLPRNGGELALLQPDDLRRGAWAVASFIADEPTRHLDIRGTVAATCAQGGIPVLVYQRARYPKEIWLWRDRRGVAPDAGQLFQELCKGLARLALPVRTASFWSNPAELYSETGKPFSPLDVEGRREQVWLFLFTDGRWLRGLLDSALEGPGLAVVLRSLALWPQLVFVDTARGEHGLERLLTKYALECIEPEQVIDRLSGLVHPASDLTPQRHNYLHAWQAAACLCADPVPWDTARALLQALQLPALSQWHYPALAATGEQVSGGLVWSQEQRCNMLDWLAHAQTFDASRLERTQLGRTLQFWRAHYREEIVRRQKSEDDSHAPWTESPAHLRIEMELAFLDLWDAPDQAARDLYRFYGNSDFRHRVAERIADYTYSNGARVVSAEDNAKGHTAVQSPFPTSPLPSGERARERGQFGWGAERLRRHRIRLPWTWDSLRGRSRRLLQDMGFQPPPRERVTPRLSGGLALAAGFMLGMLAIGGYRLGAILSTLAPVIPEKAVFDSPVFRAQVIEQLDRTGAGTWLATGSAKHLVSLRAGPMQRFGVSWNGGWAGEKGQGYANPDVSGNAGGAIWYAGTLAQPIRGCEAGWPRRSLVVLDTDGEDPAAQELAAALLDKGSADKVLIGRDWNPRLELFQELPVARTGPDQLIVVTDRQIQRPEFAGSLAVVRLDRMSRERLDGLRKKLDFAGVEALKAVWGDVDGVVSREGSDIKLRGGPSVSEPDSESGLRFVTVCGGSFTMGSSEGSEDESPPHTVTLPGFELTRTEITNGQYRRYDSAWQFPEGKEEFPAAKVDWKQARAYCEHFGLRLPTEAEWEYAARGGSQAAWSFGNDQAALGDYAWHVSNSGRSAHAVGTRQPNPLGLYDMHGNVWEWVADCYEAKAYQDRDKPISLDPPEDALNCRLRVLRGGSAWSRAGGLRSARRGRDQPEVRGGGIGFRCARAPAASD